MLRQDVDDGFAHVEDEALGSLRTVDGRPIDVRIGLAAENSIPSGEKRQLTVRSVSDLLGRGRVALVRTSKGRTNQPTTAMMSMAPTGTVPAARA